MMTFLSVAAVVFITLAIVFVVSYLIDRNTEHHEQENN